MGKKLGLAILSLILSVAVLGSFMPTAAHAELTEAEKQALEAQKKADELAQEAAKGGGAPAPAPNVVTAKIQGRISNLKSDAITVGIIGENVFAVTANTTVTNRGNAATISNIFVGDKVVVTYNASTKEAVAIEAEGYGFPATYVGTDVTVFFVGIISRPPRGDFGMIAGGAGIKLDPGVAQVTINGAPATINDIRVGDRLTYVLSNSFDLKAIFVKIAR